jgi:site-specific DNA-methyltransferase (adenine-specific)
MHTSGGAKVMGSYPYPRGGIVKIDFEHILLFRKQGKAPSVSKESKDASKLTDEEWNTYFSSHWHFNGEHQNRHIAVFPKELPLRLIKMFSFVGDTVCDPFMGSGTTAAAAVDLSRNWIGSEISEKYCDIIKERLGDKVKEEPLW